MKMVAMARKKSDREELMRESPALIRRVGLSVPGRDDASHLFGYGRIGQRGDDHF